MGTRPCGGDCFNDRSRYHLRRSSVLEAKEEEEEGRLSWPYSSIQGSNCSENREETKLQWNRSMKEEEEEEENRSFPKKRGLLIDGPLQLNPFIFRSPP